MASTKATLGVLILLASTVAVACSDYDDPSEDTCDYDVDVQTENLAGELPVLEFTMLDKDGHEVWSEWIVVRSDEVGSSDPFHFSVRKDQTCRDPCHLILKVQDPGLNHLLPVSVVMEASRDNQREDEKKATRRFTPVVPKIDPTTKQLVPAEADMNLCGIPAE